MKLPPFAKRHAAANFADPLAIYCGFPSLAVAKHCGNGLALPEGDNPAAYRWPVRTRTVLVCEVGRPNDAGVALLAETLIVAGASRVSVFRCALVGVAYRSEYRPTVRSHAA